MTSLHSWLGMITICLFGLQINTKWDAGQWLLGFFSFVFPGAEMSARGSYRPWHVFGGLAIFFSLLNIEWYQILSVPTGF
ncbi:hypothetical protein NC653_021257 [Populus alba x Populus x berolinensis]|uniref:Cytochrome b561 domain-containing protein n=1 Tax=Populus alba x Populus x berolinensis TaxID=444605 RepID=A0AAD6QDK6_9ROSI|nr:hypothetical protein NC653_021257 [Populus alba x Populus x berolinensis]